MNNKILLLITLPKIMGALFLIIVYTGLIVMFLMAARDLRRQIEK